MSEPFLGEIRMFAGSFAPRGWALCDGQLLDISQQSALFSLLGTTYGGDGRSTFGVPDLRGRVAIHAGRSPGGSNYVRGQMGGLEYIQLNTAQLAAHSHVVSVTAKAVGEGGNQSTPGDHVWAAAPRAGTKIYSDATPDTDMKEGSVVGTGEDAGGNQPHENRPPYQTVNYIIALVGLFPSRS